MSTGVEKNLGNRALSADFAKNIEQAKRWLSQDVYPLWGQRGIDKSQGGFVEVINFDGTVPPVSRRAMVQCRQIYAFITAKKLNCYPEDLCRSAVLQGTRYLIDHFSLPSGAFRHSVDVKGAPLNNMADLYNQAFCLFALAHAYSLLNDVKIKNRALELLQYLITQRRTPHGGYTEVSDLGELSYKSNPHMHLYEAAIAWMQIDTDTRWWDLGHELTELCLNHFIDPKTQVLGEYFDASWSALRDTEGVFVYEPGHQYEWSWLMSLYQGLTGQDLKNTRHLLFHLAEKHGTSAKRRIVYDEMWSDFRPKLQSSRFWPQCERIKAAVRLGLEVTEPEQAPYARAADEALETLFRFFDTPHLGLWFDQISSDDTFSGTSAKASSLYHIVNAIEEYSALRPKFSPHALEHKQ